MTRYSLLYASAALTLLSMIALIWSGCPYLPDGFLLREQEDDYGYLMRWKRARADSFDPIDAE